MGESVSVPSRDLAFPVFDVVSARFGAPGWGGWVEADGAIFAVARVRGGAPDKEGPDGSRQGVTVWSFAPDSVSEDYSGPAHQAVLAFARKYAEGHSISVRQSAERLIGSASSGGVVVPIVVNGGPAVGRLLEVEGLGSVISCAEPTHAFAAAFFLADPVLQFERVVALNPLRGPA
ncbi:hypothetical protein Acy02nite_51530 [Actinoplanes cyaneus]|uniref:Uncharacterized protein n=1 Tax=Actinoplanes cyaneus TaxID=52696 RepID=A0A919IL73_9ACTN|nr:hypothetical protein [Actinoplanes cyaneus]GID67272.1 hypothetical protein Acy02nite_51530 [Actinoplanes cyaneus]